MSLILFFDKLFFKLNPFISFLIKSQSIFNTFRRRGTKKVKDSESQEAKMTLFREEMNDIQSNVAERWRKCKGISPEEAVVSY